MGPQASCELYRIVNEKSVNTHQARRNADFPHLLISNLPVPDLINDRDAEARTVAMVKAEAQRLDGAGVTDLFLACNTMHLYADGMFGDLNCRFHSLIDAVGDRLAESGVEKVFLLGTKTTIATNLYQDSLKRRGIRYATPSAPLLSETVSMILGAISGESDAGKLKRFYQEIEQEARGNGAAAIALSCTELPLIVRGAIGGLPTLSSLDVLADKICGLHYGA